MNIVEEVQEMVSTLNEIEASLKEHQTWEREQRIIQAKKDLNKVMEAAGWEARLN